MATNFPTALDTFTNPTATDYLNSPSHSAQHANANDAIEALEAKLGIDASAVTTSHSYKLSGVTGTDKAASLTGTEALSNKTLSSPVLNTGVSGSAISTSATLAENSDTILPSQKAVKSYVDGASGIKYAADAEATDAYVINPSPAISAYAVGQVFLFKANTANTGACSLNVNSKGAVAIRKKGNTDLANNDILAGNMVLVTYNTLSLSNQVVDTYNESNQASYTILYGNTDSDGDMSGQVFNSGNYKTITLKSCKFYLEKNGSPTGSCVAKLYAITGTPGTNAVPTGSPLATSDNLDISTLSTGSYALFTLNFSGANQISLTPNTWYAIVISYTGGNSSNYLKNAEDNTSPTHSGNYILHKAATPAWVALAAGTKATPFYVYADIVNERFEMLSQIAN